MDCLQLPILEITFLTNNLDLYLANHIQKKHNHYKADTEKSSIKKQTTYKSFNQ